MAGVTLAAAATVATAAPIPLKESTMIIEYNASADDVGIQFFLDSDGWRTVEIFDPNGMEIFSADTEGSLTRQGGGTELFLESVEPAISDLPFSRFFKRFPEGIYRFRARNNTGILQLGSAEFTHEIPAGPVIILPAGSSLPGANCHKLVATPVTIAWNPVTTSIDGDPINVVGYEVIVENDDLNFDVKFPAGSNPMLMVPDGLLQPRTEYIFEVLAVAESGNQTITEGCFKTAR
jgi:hypothetical protein